MRRSHPGDVTQTVNQICCGLTTDMLRGLPSPPREERGGCAGARGLRWQVRCWGRCGSEQPYPHACVPDWMTSSPAICSLLSTCLPFSLPVVCSSTLQLFAVTTHLFAALSSGVRNHHPSCSPSSQISAVTTPAVHGHPPSCLQLPPSALYNLSPAVCSHQPSCSQSPSPFGHQVRLAQD